MKFDISGISEWEPKDIYDSLNKNVLNSVRNTKTVLPNIKRNINGQLYVSFNGNCFKQDPITIPNNVINIYVAYKSDPISSTRNTDYTIQNALFGAMKITKNTDSSKNNYTGYGLCFDEDGEFGHTVRHDNFNCVTNAKNVIIFGVDTSSSIHATNDDKDNTDLPLDKLIKFSVVTISNRLLIEKDNKLFLESYLEECLYKDYWYEHSINGQSKRIEN